MFKIGEFSKLTQVTIRMLRYYDEVGLLKPAKIHPNTGYRMYSVDQIPILNKIIYLRDSGFNVSEIQEVLNLNNDKLLLEKLDIKYLEIEESIKDEEKKLKRIEAIKKEIIEGKEETPYNISIKRIPSYQVLSLRKIIPNYYAEGELWKELGIFVEEHKIEVSNNTLSIYHDEEYKETNVDVEVCVSVKNMGNSEGNFIYRNTEDIPIMASTMVYGDFSNIAEAYINFAKWLQQNSEYEISGKTRQIVHRGSWNEDNPDNYLIELQIPLSNR